jgi:hypothetical protein
MAEFVLELTSEYLDIKDLCKTKMISRNLNNFVNQVYLKEQKFNDIILTTKNIYYKAIKKCVICKRKRTGEYTPYGLYAHNSCERPLLINTYYTPSYISEHYVLTKLPFKSLLGYMRPTREQYWYNVVWKNINSTLIRKEYTLEYLLETDPIIIENRIKHLQEEKKRLAEQQLKIKEEKERRLKKQSELLIKKQKALDKRVSKFTKINVLEYVNNESVIYGDYYDLKCSPQIKLKDIKENIRILKKIKSNDTIFFTYKIRSLLDSFFRTKNISVEILIKNILAYNDLGIQLKNSVILQEKFTEVLHYKDLINLDDCKLDKNFSLKLNRLKNLPDNCNTLKYVLTGQITS